MQFRWYLDTIEMQLSSSINDIKYNLNTIRVGALMLFWSDLGGRRKAD